MGQNAGHVDKSFFTFFAVGFQPALGDQAGTYFKAEETSTKKTLGSVPWPN